MYIKNIIVNFLSEINKKCIQKKITIKDNGSYWSDLNKHKENKNFLGKKSNWITIQGDNSLVNVWYVEKSNDGIVALDHLF